MQNLSVSKNKRFIVNEDQTPFFPLGDTAFELLYRLSREEIDYYLSDRASKRFNLVTVTIFTVLERLDWPNSEGVTALIGGDPAQPNEAFFSLLDYVVTKAESLGIYIGLLPFTPAGDKNFGIFTQRNARAYGEYLGKRYRNRPILWIFGGNFKVDTEAPRSILRAMAEGVAAGNGRPVLGTFLPPELKSSSEFLQEESWLDFNSVQCCHSARNLPTYDFVAEDYAKTPVKPTWEIEYSWENGGVNWDPKNGRYDAYDVRKGAYWALFAGAFGCIYGCYDVFSFYRGDSEIKEYQFAPGGTPWKIALQFPGAGQMQYVRSLMESRPFLTRIPDQGLLASDAGSGPEHIRATRDQQGRFAFVYAVTGHPLTVNLSNLSGDRLIAWWFDPRLGTAVKIGEFPRMGTRLFTPPSSGYGHDWILVLDDAAQKWSAPGS